MIVVVLFKVFFSHHIITEKVITQSLSEFIASVINGSHLEQKLTATVYYKLSLRI